MNKQIQLIATNSQSALENLVALNFEIPNSGLPEWIELIPSGRDVIGRDGRKWLNDRPKAITKAFNAHGCDIVVDIEHSTEHKAPKGDPAPAVGWISELDLRNDSTWGRVAWNVIGKKAIINREYRYYSPVFAYEKATNRIVKLLSIGLTNRPNLRFAALNSEEKRNSSSMQIAALNKEQARIAAMFGNTAEDLAKYGEGINNLENNSDNYRGLNSGQAKLAMVFGNTADDIAKYGA